jgi:simple sugar transport system permease protein
MLVMGMTIGATLGSFITYLKVQPFIVTLAGMWIARGLCFFISDDAIAINNRVYDILGKTKILIPGLSDPVTKQGDFISIMVIVELLVLLIAMYIAQYTRFGRTMYAIGGNEGRNEQSARLMGLAVERTKVMVYTFNGLCSALAGVALSIDVSSGHGLYARGFELTVIASVVMGGTMLTGGAGYVFGTLFGVLITGVIQTLIQFNGQLSSWWTNIVVGALTLIFIGVQSLLMARKSRQAISKKTDSETKKGWAIFQNRPWLAWGSGVVLLLIVVSSAVFVVQNISSGSTTNAATPVNLTCQLKPFRQEQAANLIKGGAILAYERNGSENCVDELYAIYPDGRIIGDNGITKIEKQMTTADVEKLLALISDRGWFTSEMYDTWHTPCSQCYGYYLTVSYKGQAKTVKAVDGGTDAPANYWQVVSSINGVLPKFAP